MRYLFFKGNVLKVKSKIKDDDLVKSYDKMLTVDESYVTSTEDVDSDGEKDYREKTYDEISSEQDYSIKRKIEYPSLGDQLDYIYHNGVDAWKDDIVKPIKEKYPK
jgi:hypothetical protein